MNLSETAEVAVPRIEQTAAKLVICAECGVQSDAVTLSATGFNCAWCLQPICVMCGCTQSRACEGGCYWISPGICSSHEEELRQLVRDVFGEAR